MFFTSLIRTLTGSVALYKNSKGLIRKYFPKKRYLSTVIALEEYFVMDHLNARPEKCLDGLTPYQEFFQYSSNALQFILPQ